MAERADAVVFSIEYNKGPEKPFPNAQNDCFNCLKHIYENYEKYGIDKNRIAVGGDSAGGNLALSTAIKARNSGLNWIKALVLAYPCTVKCDATMDGYVWSEDVYDFSEEQGDMEKKLINLGHMVKYGEDPAATGEESQVDWIVYRYADVLTLLSEAIVRQNNAVTEEALDLLNQVRTRAGIPAYTLSDIKDVQDFLDKVLEERGHELWFEGARRTDLIRHGKYIEYARKYRNSVTAQDYMNLMPLPQSVINESKGQVIQNPGY